MQINWSTTQIGSWHSTGAIQYCEASHATFDSQSKKSSFSEAMAYRGDLIACEVDFSGVRNGKLPVVFFLNGREIARAWTKRISEEIKVFPFISMAYEGIRVLAKVWLIIGTSFLRRIISFSSSPFPSFLNISERVRDNIEHEEGEISASHSIRSGESGWRRGRSLAARVLVFFGPKITREREVMGGGGGGGEVNPGLFPRSPPPPPPPPQGTRAVSQDPPQLNFLDVVF